VTTTQGGLAIAHLLSTVAERKASDLHLTVGNPPILRIDGKLNTLAEEAIVTPDFLEDVVKTMLSPDQRRALEERRELTVAYQFENRARFKANVYHQKGFLAVSLRLIPATIPSIAELGLPAIVETFAELERGLVIVTGPFGSGRTTTIAALIQSINQKRSEHIVTIERPIEYLFLNNQSVIEQREVGVDTVSIEQALTTASHEDVDVVMVSELEDADAIRAALTAVESGRLLLTTMTTESAVKTIEKLLLSFNTTELPQVRKQLAENLRGIVSQRLLPRVGGGRIVVAEVLIPNEPIRSVLRDGVLYQLQNILHTSREEGMVSLDRALAELVKAGVVLLDDAMQFTSDRAALRQFAIS
jgi:twitching motility protein PilT